MKKNETVQEMNNALAELVAKAKAGDQNAFTELYDRTAQDLYRCIRAMTRDEDLAWDIQQDSYLRAYNSLDKLENNAAFFPWLRRIAVNVTATQMSQRRTLTFSELACDEEEDPFSELPDFNVDNQPELSLDRKETSRLVQEILSKLPEEQQLIVGMRYYDELSVKEIADTLHLSTGAVKAQLFHGRKKVEAAVRALEKKGVKLYGLSPMAFLVALMGRMEPAEAAAQAAAKAVAAKAAANAVAVTAKPVTALTFSQMVKGSIGKIVIGALSVAAIGGGIWAGAKLLDKEQQPVVPIQPTTTVNAVLLSSNTVTATDESEDLTEPVVYVTTPAEETTEATEPEGSTKPTESTEPSESTEPTKPSEQDEYSGTCGEHLTWRFDPESGLLTIEGSGDMDDFNDEPGDPLNYWRPWNGFLFTRVELPEGLTSIGDHAFTCCDITDVIIPDGVTHIGSGAFAECSSLSYISIPDSVTTIEDLAFTNSGLKSVTIPGSVKTVGNAFCNCSLETVTINSGVTAIDESAFCDNFNLTVVLIPDTVTSIGQNAFYDCRALRSITIPSSVTSIGEHAVGYVYDSDAIVHHAKVEDFTVSGVAGSAAETYAKENGFAFSDSPSMGGTDLSVILTRIERDNMSSSVARGLSRITVVNPIGGRYLAKVVRTVGVRISESDLMWAKNFGSIQINGQLYNYTESQEQFNEWMGWDESYWSIEDLSGRVVVNPDNKEFYGIAVDGENYCLCKELGGVTTRLETVTDEDWVWLDGDMKLVQSFDDTEYTLASYLQDHTISPNVKAEFQIEENGAVEIIVDAR